MIEESMTWTEEHQGQSHGWWTLHEECEHVMVPPQGDLRADLVRAPVLTLFLAVLAALAGAQMTFPTFPGSASVLLPLTCLTYALPQPAPMQRQYAAGHCHPRAVQL